MKPVTDLMVEILKGEHMKTEPYDPDKHGDGYSVMVPMHVEPPELVSVRVWSGPYSDGVLYRYLDGKWHTKDHPGGPLKPVMDKIAAARDGWTFRPAAPEPVKSYAEYVLKNGCFQISVPLNGRTWLVPPRTDKSLVGDIMVYEALRDWLNDNYPIQDNLPEGEGDL